MSALPVTAELRAAVALLEGVAPERFARVCERLLETLPNRAGVFTPAEEARLREVLGLGAANLDTLVAATAYVFETAAYDLVAPEALGAAMEEAGMTEPHVAALTETWTSLGPAYVQRLKAAAFGGPKVLVDTNWYMHLMMGESGLARLRDTSAIFELSLEQPGETGPQPETVGLEFSHAELSDFFGKLERIQEQLDALG